MRQKNDATFAQALKSLVRGEADNKVHQIFRDRQTNNLMKKNINVPDSAIHLFEYNRDKDKFNNAYIDSIQEELHIVEAIDFMAGNASDQIKKSTLKYVKSLPADKTSNLCTQVTLKLTGIYMLKHNIDVSDGLVNGVNGILKHIIWGRRKANNEVIVRRIYMEFLDDDDTGKKARQREREEMLREKIDSHWTPIDYVTSRITGKNPQGFLYNVERKQIPLVIGKGTTFHQAQGSTLIHGVVLHISQKPQISLRKFYTGASRPPNLGNLFIEGKYVPLIFNNADPARAEINRMLKEKPLKLDMIYPQRLKSDENMIIMYNNVRSLHAHLEDIKSDRGVMCADILLLFELSAVQYDN